MHCGLTRHSSDTELLLIGTLTQAATLTLSDFDTLALLDMTGSGRSIRWVLQIYGTRILAKSRATTPSVRPLLPCGPASGLGADDAFAEAALYTDRVAQGRVLIPTPRGAGGLTLLGAD